MTEEELERLSVAMDKLSILDLKCEALPDPDSKELCWFKHPGYENIFAKFGPDKNRRRVLRVWLFKCDDNVVILSVNLATEPELHYLATLNSRN